MLINLLKIVNSYPKNFTKIIQIHCLATIMEDHEICSSAVSTRGKVLISWNINAAAILSTILND